MSLATRAPRKRGDTRTSMLISAAEVMRERGAAGVTIDEVLTRSGAPRGSVYYHFPDGRNQILAGGAAIRRGCDHGRHRRRRRPRCQGAASTVRRILGTRARRKRFSRRLPGGRGSDRLGRDEVRLSAEAARIFAHWRTALTSAFVADGFVESDADSLAVMSIATLEGAVVLCRSMPAADPAQGLRTA